MASSRPRGSSFSRNISNAATSQIPGVKLGPNGTSFLSSGIPDLDQILGGGFTLGSLVMVMEDPEAPHSGPGSQATPALCQPRKRSTRLSWNFA